MSVSTGTIGGNIRSKIRTKYFKVLFAIGFVIIAALYLAFYQLIFGAINEALGVQSRFFVDEAAELNEKLQYYVLVAWYRSF